MKSATTLQIVVTSSSVIFSGGRCRFVVTFGATGVPECNQNVAVLVNKLQNRTCVTAF